MAHQETPEEARRREALAKRETPEETRKREEAAARDKAAASKEKGWHPTTEEQREEAHKDQYGHYTTEAQRQAAKKPFPYNEANPEGYRTEEEACAAAVQISGADGKKHNVVQAPPGTEGNLFYVEPADKPVTANARMCGEYSNGKRV